MDKAAHVNWLLYFIYLYMRLYQSYDRSVIDLVMAKHLPYTLGTKDCCES
jgi:hypothetical protein